MIMANLNKQNTAWPQCDHNSLIEKDPMIVKVPMDNVDWGSRKGTMNKARNGESGGNGRMGIVHVGGKK
jgi:hypothetical protein